MIIISTYNMILTTIAYLKKDNHTLLLHRIKKEKDINKGKWIGVGGKLEKGESPEQCIRREIYEETHLNIHKLNYHGFVVFPGIYYGEDEGMFVFSSDDFSGELNLECNEGELKWVSDDLVMSLPMWEGDYHLFEWMKDNHIHNAKITYDDHGHVIDYVEEIY